MFPDSETSSHLCQKCRLLHDYCYCSKIPVVDNATWLSLIIHIAEIGRVSNTGIPLVRSLVRSNYYIIGKVNTPGFSGFDLQLAHQPVLLSHEPSAKSPSEIRDIYEDSHLQLIVLDGSYRQTRNIFRRNPSLYTLPKVTIRNKPTRYKLRRAPSSNALCTLEAVAYALEELDGLRVSEPLFELLELINFGVMATNSRLRSKNK